MKFINILLFTMLLAASSVLFAACQSQRVKVQILGSGGPELNDGRASSSYLIWLDGKGIILIDTGSGSSLNYEKSDAKLNDLEVVAFTHFHVDHSADFPAYIKSFYFSNRSRNLNVFGPKGNEVMPSTNEFIKRLFGKSGVFPYLNEYVSTKKPSQFKISAKNVQISKHKIQAVYRTNDYSLLAAPVHHGPIPALAWRIKVAGCSLTFSGDMSNRFQTLGSLAKETDILIAHNAIPESQKGIGRSLHMPPSEIAKIAKKASAKQVILSHRMKRTLGNEKEILRVIKNYYHGPILFAEDMDTFIP